jgi:hypothetical protein
MEEIIIIFRKKNPPNSAATAVCSVNSFQKRFKNAEEELALLKPVL